MKIEHLTERVNDYLSSIETVVRKKNIWKNKTKDLLAQTLNNIVAQYNIGWEVQELNWINSNEAVNITFDSFPPVLIEKTNQLPTYQFLQGGALVFSQTYSGDVNVFIVFPGMGMQAEVENIDFSTYSPNEISEKLIVEKVDEFLKEMIKWEVPTTQKRVGFQN